MKLRDRRRIEYKLLGEGRGAVLATQVHVQVDCEGEHASLTHAVQVIGIGAAAVDEQQTRSFADGKVRITEVHVHAVTLLHQASRAHSMQRGTMTASRSCPAARWD